VFDGCAYALQCVRYSYRDLSPQNKGEIMTRKDYEKIAQVMNGVLMDNAEPFQWMGTVNSLAHMLKEDNEKFDINKFRDACGWVTCTGLKSGRV
jgi:hypothetical protein